jgi:predicted aldo/keto reductase-like oxidoreductase
MSIPQRILGKTEKSVTILGLGGEGMLRTFGLEKDSYILINRAIDLGINYFESARAYSGSESYYGLAIMERRREIFLTSKSHARDKKGALNHLQETLENMKTDYLDLWQIHDVRTQEDITEIFGKNGAIEAFVEARDKGKTRYIGITGHHDPSIIRRAIDLFDFDTVLIPVNPAEPFYKSFIETVLPAAVNKNMGIIAMKAYLRGIAQKLPWVQTLEPFYRFAASQPVHTVVIGCDNVEQLEENVEYAQRFLYMKEKEQQDFIERISSVAQSLMYYKP